MKVAVGIYRSGDTAGGQLGAAFGDLRLLRQRRTLLLHQGFQPILLGRVGPEELPRLLEDCHRAGADCLWLCCRSPMASLRRQYLRDPAAFAGLSLWVDGLVSPDLPPTTGQLQRLAAMGFSYLEEGIPAPLSAELTLAPKY